MVKPEKDEEREERIDMEIMPDAYGSEERAISWHNFLSDTFSFYFPFAVRCIKALNTSPLEVGEKVKVIKLAAEEECERDILVVVRWKRRQLTVPLSQLEGIDLDEDAQQAIDDWHYWVNRGYKF
ncbi:MAG: calcium-binding protein [Ktedonobacteraceae bacterium]